MDPEKLNRRQGEGKGKNSFKQLAGGRGEANHKRLLNTENKLRVDGVWGRGGREEAKMGDGH